MKIKYISIPISVILVLICLSCRSNRKIPSAKQEISDDTCQSGQITVWGEAPIFTSVAAARAKAKKDACRRAIEKCIGTEVASATGVSDGQSILHEIFAKSDGICKNDKLLEDKEYQLDTVKMLRSVYRFKVKRADIRDKINLMQKLVGNPKVMVLIREEYNLPEKKVEGFASRNALAAKVLRKNLIAKGYHLIDSAKIRKYLRNEKHLTLKAKNINDRLKDAAMASGADVMIIGRVEVFPQSISALKGTDFKSFRATGNITILSLWGSTRILGEYTDSQAGAHVSPYNAARKAVDSFARGRYRNRTGGMLAYVDETLKDEWAEATRNNKIQITVTNIDPQVAGIFRDDLEERTSVNNIDEISASKNKLYGTLTFIPAAP